MLDFRKNESKQQTRRIAKSEMAICLNYAIEHAERHRAPPPSCIPSCHSRKSGNPAFRVFAKQSTIVSSLAF
jgi:hypothetical protein